LCIRHQSTREPSRVNIKSEKYSTSSKNREQQQLNSKRWLQNTAKAT
jgi:hypothetical protein